MPSTYIFTTAPADYDYAACTTELARDVPADGGTYRLVRIDDREPGFARGQVPRYESGLHVAVEAGSSEDYARGLSESLYRPLLSALGFEVWQMGGGCRSWGLGGVEVTLDNGEVVDGHLLLGYAADPAYLPAAGAPALLGVYTDDDAYSEGPVRTWEAPVERIAEVLADVREQVAGETSAVHVYQSGDVTVRVAVPMGMDGYDCIVRDPEGTPWDVVLGQAAADRRALDCEAAMVDAARAALSVAAADADTLALASAECDEQGFALGRVL